MAAVWHRMAPATPAGAVYVGRPPGWRSRGRPLWLVERLRLGLAGEDAAASAARFFHRHPALIGYGNPFERGEDGDRDAVCDRHEAYALARLCLDPAWLVPLRGRDLACWCAPARCHADTLLDLAGR